MSSSSLSSAVIGLEICNILLLSLLMATPAPKHAMVKSLMLACLLRSVLDVLPPIVQKARPEQFSSISQNAQTTLASFCVSDSILLRYVTVVKAAFAVSFTMPALWLAIIQMRPKCSADDYPRLTGRTVLLLCIAPYAWALPVLIMPIPRLVQGQLLSVSFNINSCYFTDKAFTIVSLVFTLIPLAFAVIVSGSVILVISRWRNADPSHRAAICSKRTTRFAALVVVTVISAIFYTVVLTLWVKGHEAWAHAWPFRLSVIWEAITPMLFFIIFAAQDEIYETWLGWLSRVVHIPRREPGQSRNTPSAPQYVTYDSYISPTGHPTYSKVPHDAETPTVTSPPPFFGQIIQRPTSMKILRNSQYLDRRFQAASDTGGLSPPPRPPLPRTHTVEEPPPSKGSRFRLPFVHNPSLSAFGSQPSMQSQPNSSSMGDFSGEDDGILATTTVSHERIPWEGPRSDTPMSTRTFGRTTTSRR
ncbi:uncharacterized protein TRAVEDRAFT_25751 [Trametes versicolor FP-101664 SS1]|uniref:uncharacterized protein n=1 Tax=Trametes versicolor (strain FP-101664) TaxID=717944 RepID=UPI00046221D9|nr:uncharacterized protein TRAVEDRAFT_25751 [Trametes versicolor FP-101664 SS1]EIW64638.1 hypothetical protein TRAVEDRAFT_25751 [Trametes versicolor FP-101664 SS1]